MVLKVMKFRREANLLKRGKKASRHPMPRATKQYGTHALINFINARHIRKLSKVGEERQDEDICSKNIKEEACMYGLPPSHGVINLLWAEFQKVN